MRASSSRPAQRRRILPPSYLTCLVLVLIYVLLIFIVPPAADAYFDAQDRNASEPARLGVAARPDPDPEYRW